MPSQSELFWRGSFKDTKRIGNDTYRVGSFFDKLSQAASALVVPPLRKIGVVFEGAGKIDMSIGNFLYFIGRWGEEQFPEPYW